MTANITFYLDQDPVAFSSPCSAIGGFYNLGAVGSDMTLWDVDLFANGYWRAKLTPLGHFVVEAQLLGATFTVDGGPITLFDWVWLSSAWQSNGSGGQGLAVAVYDPSNTLVNRTFAVAHVNSGNAPLAIPAVLGDGQSLTSSYQDMQDSFFFRKSKIYLAAPVHNGASPPYNNLLGPPTSDVASGGLVAETYMGRQPVGGAAAITDGSLVLADLIPSISYTVWANGPFP